MHLHIESIFLMKKWNAKTCTGNAGCNPSSCTTSSGWIVGNSPDCIYRSNNGTGGCGSDDDRTCIADIYTEAICLGN